MSGFIITSRSEAELFEKYTLDFMKSFLQPYFHCNFRLGEIFDDCRTYLDGGKIFSASLDLYINIHLVACDVWEYCGLWNKYFSKENPLAKSIVNISDDIFKNQQAFIVRLSLHKIIISFIPKYRALWDKIFGLYFLIYQPIDFEKYVKSKSKKKYFNNNFKHKEKISKKIIEYIENGLQDFDDRYRTPEIHGQGSIKKWSFEPITGAFTKNHVLRDILENHWQNFMKIVGLIMLMFDDIKDK